MFNSVVLAAPLPGYCAATGSPGNCSSDLMGSWPIRQSRIRGMPDCIERCRSCRQCAFVSLSLAPSHRECSWYAQCNLDDLRPSPETGEYWTVQVKSPRRPLQARRTKSLLQHPSRRVAILVIAIGSRVRCGLIQWCEGARRLADAMPSDWDIQLIVIGSDSAATREVCSCPTWIVWSAYERQRVRI